METDVSPPNVNAQLQASSCITPVSGMEIRNSTVLCRGVYRLYDAGWQGAIKIVGDNLVLDGNNAEIVGDVNGYGVFSDGFKNMTIKNLTVSNYSSAIHLDGARDSVLDGITSRFSDNMGLIITSSCSNVTIRNSQIENVTYSHGIYLAGKSCNVFNNTIRSVPKALSAWGAGIYCIGDNNKIARNYIDNTDIGVYSRYGSNTTIEGNTIKNSTLNSDWYDVGIFVFEHAKDVKIINNIIEGAGTIGILVMKNSSNVLILNNSIDNYELSTKYKTRSDDAHEPPSAIFISEVYKQWLSDCSEMSTDNISKISNYKSKNITISGNTFGPNVQIPLRVQGAKNVVHDLTGFWFRKVQFPTQLVEADEFYMGAGTNAVRSYTYYQVTDLQQKGYGDYMKGTVQNMIDYMINQSVMQFRNSDNKIRYNVSLIDPRVLLFNTYNNVSQESVNVTLPADGKWYRTINMSVTPASGNAGVLVSLFNSSFVRWNAFWSGSNDVNHFVCGLNSSSCGLRVDGFDVKLVPVAYGCANFSYSGTANGRVFELYSLAGIPSSPLVTPASITFSNFLPVVGENVSVYVDVANIGSVSAEANVSCFDGLPSSGVVIGSKKVNLPAGSVVPVNFSWIAYPEHTHGIYVTAVAVNPPGNSSMAYRMIYVQSKPDLYVDPNSIVFTPSSNVTVGMPVMIRADVRNNGEANASSFIVRFIDGTDTIGDRNASVGGGGNVSVNNITWVPSSNGTHNITVLADVFWYVNESSKSNNYANKTVYVLLATTSTTTTTSTATTSTLPTTTTTPTSTSSSSSTTFTTTTSSTTTTTTTTTTRTTTTTTITTSTTTTVPSSTLCWSGSYGYISRSSDQLNKFCKCVQGAYSHLDHTSSGKHSYGYYIDKGNNINWQTGSASSSTPYYRVKCSDGNWYSTNKDYYYPPSTTTTSTSTSTITYVSSSTSTSISTSLSSSTSTSISTSLSSSTTTSTPSSATTSTSTSIQETTTTTGTTTTSTVGCDMEGDYPPCGAVTIFEVVDYINLWSVGEADLSNVVKLIIKWAG